MLPHTKTPEYNIDMFVPNRIVQHVCCLAFIAISMTAIAKSQPIPSVGLQSDTDCARIEARVKEMMDELRLDRSATKSPPAPPDQTNHSLKDRAARMVVTPPEHCLVQNPRWYAAFRLPFLTLLHKWEYSVKLTDPFSEQTIEAIRTYQKQRHLPQSGAFDYETVRRIYDDEELLRPFDWQFTIPNKQIDFEGWEVGFVSASGTWKLENQRSAILAQTTTITCHKESMSCNEITAYLGAGNLLSIDQYTHSVSTWNDKEIITKPEERLCFHVVRRLNRNTKEVTGNQYKTNLDPLCGGTDGQEKHLRLVSGSEVTSTYRDLTSQIWHQWEYELVDRLKKEAQRAEERINK
jgi:hypothetical protein